MQAAPISIVTTDAEPPRKNGYYYDPRARRYKRSVTNITRLWGDSEGLLRWGCRHASTAVWAAMQGGVPLTVEACVEVGTGAMLSERMRTADWGTDVHTACEYYLARRPFDMLLTESQRVAYNTFTEWFGSSRATALAVELVGYAPTYAGRVDAIIDIPDVTMLTPHLTKKSWTPTPGRYVCDIKTGSLHLDTHWLQVGAYTALDSVQALGPIAGGLVLNIARDAPDEIVIHAWSADELADGATHFNNLVALWERFAPKWYRTQEGK